MNLTRYSIKSGQQKKDFLRCLDRYIPNNILLDASQRYKARSLILIVAILFLLSAVSMVLVVTVDKVVSERRLITITLIGLQIFAMFLLRYYRSTTQASWYLVVLTTLTVFYIDHNNLSFQGAFSIIWMLPSTIAVMLLGGSIGLKVAAVAVIGMTTNFVLLKMDMLPAPITLPEKWLHLEFIISITIMILVTFCVFGLFSLTSQRELELSYEIEARKRFARELERAKDIAEEAANNKAMFLATMSHELRTPLNAILGNAELLSRESLNALTEKRVKDIHSSGQLLLSIINDVLDVSKMDSYGIELQQKTYDFSEQLSRIYHMMSAQVKPGVDFTVTGIDKPIHVYADPNRLAQVLLNLISNALKFTEQGAVNVIVNAQEVEQLEIKVKDSGVGISGEDAKRLFEDYVQVPKPLHQQQEGTGLGLAIVKRILIAMDGVIKLESQVGQGSVFTVTLPIKVASDSIDQLSFQENETKEIIDMSQNLSQKRLLIVDDVSMNCIVLKALLETLGVTQIEEESDGAMAVARIEKDREFDAILMDVRMPKMDGLEASRLIRDLGYEQPIIAVTANAFEEDRKACLEAGMNGFLSKPIDMEKLQRSLNDIFTE